MDWSPQQNEALEAVRRWFHSENRKQVFRLFGYAGSGKTTLAIEIRKMVKGNGYVLFGSFTGKAALVMRKKGCNGAMTLHSMIYKPRRKNRDDEDADRDIPMWELNPESVLAGAGLLIVDECSMVGEDLGRDVMSFGVPVLVLGDPAQLPPVGGAGFFTEGHVPDVMLTEIHRQAADNPIVRIATDIRTGVGIKLGNHKGAREGTGVAIITRSQLALKTELAAEQILCGKNDTRVTLNRRIRGQLQELGKLPHGRSISDPLPVVGDRIICLKNKRDRGFLNGGMWTVKEIRDRDIIAKKKGRDDVSYLAVDSIDGMGTNYAMVPNPFWFWNGKANDLHLPEKMQRSHYHEFDYGYAITCHKSQGSQWDKVLVYDESQIFGRAGEEDIPDRWLYTAATRAAEALIIVVGD